MKSLEELREIREKAKKRRSQPAITVCMYAEVPVVLLPEARELLNVWKQRSKQMDWRMMWRS